MMLRPVVHPDAQLMEHAQTVKGRSLRFSEPDTGEIDVVCH